MSTRSERVRENPSNTWLTIWSSDVYNLARALSRVYREIRCLVFLREREFNLVRAILVIVSDSGGRQTGALLYKLTAFPFSCRLRLLTLLLMWLLLRLPAVAVGLLLLLLWWWLLWLLLRLCSTMAANILASLGSVTFASRIYRLVQHSHTPELCFLSFSLSPLSLSVKPHFVFGSIYRCGWENQYCEYTVGREYRWARFKTSNLLL